MDHGGRLEDDKGSLNAWQHDKGSVDCVSLCRNEYALRRMYIIVMVCNTPVNVGLFCEVCLQSCMKKTLRVKMLQV